MSSIPRLGAFIQLTVPIWPVRTFKMAANLKILLWLLLQNYWHRVLYLTPSKNHGHAIFKMSHTAQKYSNFTGLFFPIGPKRISVTLYSRSRPFWKPYHYFSWQARSINTDREPSLFLFFNECMYGIINHKSKSLLLQFQNGFWRFENLYKFVNDCCFSRVEGHNMDNYAPSSLVGHPL